MPGMATITMARKPLPEGVVANVFRYGTGGININECRVHDSGRWPTNLVLEHRIGCCADRCEEGCPVARMDALSGIREGCKPHSIRSHILKYEGWGSITRRDGGIVGYEDEGGASRFFYRIQKDHDMQSVPQQLIDYLKTLISPPPRFGQVSVIMDLESFDWAKMASWPDNSSPGIVALGTPTPEQSAELFRVLRPGAHLVLIAPESNPIGDIGACNIEDAGMEIRDSILWIRDAGSFYYVPKANRGEREAGCENLPVRSGAESVGREEGDAGVMSPRAGAGRTAEEIHNHHPTVKPIGMMEFLLRDIPVSDKPVLDPFMGSGTTGIACIRTGHPFVGIELEPEYIAIADARIRFWANEGVGWLRDIPIESDAPQVSREVASLDDMFGWGEDD